jgi:hypothetical protein
MAAPLTISLNEHVIRSLRKWLNDFAFTHPTDPKGQAIYLDRAQTSVSRPAMVVEEVNSSSKESLGRLLTRSKYTFQITVMGATKWDTERQRAKIEQIALQKEVIPLYLWSWQYLTPRVEEVVGGGTIPAGALRFRVTAVNSQGQESLGSDAVSLTAHANAAVKMVIPPWPKSSPVAKEYRVYAGAAGAEKRIASLTNVPGDVALVHTFTSIPAGTVAIPTSSMFFLRFMRVDAVRGLTLEHPQLDGAFDAQVTLDLSLVTPRNPYPISGSAAWGEPVTNVVVTTLEVANG